MKYLKKGLAVLLTVMGSACLFSCQEADAPNESKPGESESDVTLDRFNVKAKDEAFLGDTYKILDVVARDSAGKEYIPTIEVMCDGSKVSVTNNQFTVEKLKNYEISYKVSFKGSEVVKKTIVEVKDNLGPKVVIGSYKESVALNEDVVIPKITVTDNSGATILPTVKVLFKDTAEEVAVTNGKFKAEKLGYYTIKINAKDAANNNTAKELIVVVRGENEIEGFDSKNFVETIGNIGTPNGATISYNSDKNYVLQGEGSLKFTSGSEHVKGSFPEINIAKPAIKDITGKHSLSFAVYNANPVPAEINLCDRNDGWTKIAPYSWGIVSYTTDSPVLSGKNWKDKPTAGAKDLTNLVIYFNQTTTEPMTFYIDNLRAHDAQSEDHIGEITPLGAIKAGTEFTIPVYGKDSKISTFLVNKTNGVRRAITAENNKISINESGRYSVEYIYQDGFNTEVKYNDFSIMKDKIKPALVIEDFENNPDLYWECTSQVQMNISNEHVIDGKQSLQFVIDINDGYPRMACSKAALEKYVDVYDYVTFRIFNGGSKTHKINCNDYELPALEPGLNEIKLTNKQFKDIVNGDVAANKVDASVYKIGLVTFFAFNIDDTNEPFSLFFDSFTGGYNDLDAGCNVALDFNKEFKDYTFSKIEATVGDEKVNAVDGKLTFAKEGTYDVTLTGKREGTEESTFTIKVKVSDLSKPEIALGDHATKAYANEEYTLPTITITDNIDKNLTPDIKVLFGEEEITVADNKFTPTKAGTYKVVIHVVDSSGNEVTEEYEITVTVKVAKDALTIEHFENDPLSFASANSSTKVSVTNQNVLDGEQALQFAVDQWDGYPKLYLDKEIFVPYLDKFDYVVLNIYSTGANEHNTWVNNIKLGTLKNGLNTFKLTNEEFKAMVNGDVAAHEAESGIYEVGKLGFFVNCEAPTNEGFNIIFDKFVGGYNDIDTTCNSEVDFNASFPGFTFSSIKATLGEDVLEAKDGKIKFVKPGTYTVELTGKREGTLPATFTIKVNVVDNSKPEITLGEHSLKATVNEEYVLPTATVTDNIDTDLTPTFKVLFGEEEITVAANKFTPTKEGAYKVIVSVVDSNGNEASVEFTINAIKAAEKSAITIDDFEADPASYYESRGKSTIHNSELHAIDGKQSLEVRVPSDEDWVIFHADKTRFSEYFDTFDYVTLNMFSTGSKDHRMWINEIRLPDLKPGMNSIRISNEMYKKMVNNDEVMAESAPSMYTKGKTAFVIDTQAGTGCNEEMSIFLDSFVGGYTLRCEVNKEFDLAKALPGYTITSVKATMGKVVVNSTGSKLTIATPGKYDLEVTGKRAGSSEATFKLEITAMRLALGFEDAADGSYLTPEKVNASGVVTGEIRSYGNGSFKMYQSQNSFPQFGISQDITNSADNDMDYVEFDVYVKSSFPSRTVEIKFWGGGWGPDAATYGSVQTNMWHTVSVSKAIIQKEIAAGHAALYTLFGNSGDEFDSGFELYIDSIRYTNNPSGDLKLV